ncbi:hypothetical protein CS063_07590 [Sporanaerobium hydrogeniformans]|uniref:Uncharacterized protein n=1 Tax=Sporanaerobium hydrogeniformans TaxID=3072179 RepID=A0AC61DCT4_9FIRM|nr:sporulation protein YtxC [Sporanaerobium hydrogeniformans]PHV70878.1 hypothetical protein CS063_07590 [Sporanaerobium hydrogeniformans]
MDYCTLYTTKYKKELLEELNENREEYYPYPFKITCQNDVYKIECGQLSLESIEDLAHILCDFIQKEAVSKVTREYLKKRDDLSVLDKRDITRHFMTQQYITRQEGISSLIYYFLYSPLLETLKEQKELNVDGWLCFRLSKYKIILQDILEQFIEEYMVKKDFVNLIKLIREINFLTQPLEDTMHLVCEERGRLRLLDEEMKDVTQAVIKKYCQDLLQDSTLSEQDLIMNVLITICPRELIIHQKERVQKPQFIKALEGIFGLQVSYCNGCHYCR